MMSESARLGQIADALQHAASLCTSRERPMYTAIRRAHLELRTRAAGVLAPRRVEDAELSWESGHVSR